MSRLYWKVNRCLFRDKSGNPTESSALCRGVAGPVVVSPSGVTRVIWELDDGEHIQKPLHPVTGLRPGLLVASDPGDTQEDKNSLEN